MQSLCKITSSAASAAELTHGATEPSQLELVLEKVQFIPAYLFLQFFEWSAL